jgi:prepilin-type N-terminal cleavage/methylation domain-containing protein
MNFFSHKFAKKKNKGFTILELLVATTLFTVVVTSVSSSFIGIIDSYRKATAMRLVMDNLNASIESMVRGLKTGTTYHCGSTGTKTDPFDCASGLNYIAFETATGLASSATDQVVYCLGGTAGCSATANQIFRSTDGGSTFLAVTPTPPAVSITQLLFFVTGTTPNDNLQPRVVIIVRGTATGTNQKSATAFSIQTSVTQRGIDLQ